MSRNVLKSSLLNAGFNIVFQILCRFITFGINAFIVRRIGKEVLGIMNVRLLLLESSLLFISREAITRASLSSNTQKKEKCNWPQLINHIWLTVPTCALICLPCVYIWLYILTPVAPHYKDQYEFACYAIAISCVIELCAEIVVFTMQIFCFVKLRVIFNTLHIFIRSAIFLRIVLLDRAATITAFGIAQLASALTIVLTHYGYFYFYIAKWKKYKESLKKKSDDPVVQNVDNGAESSLFTHMEDFPYNSLKEMLPGMLPNRENILNFELLTLTISFVKQGLLKQFLTEGEKYVMSLSPLLSFSQQATYDVVNNIGSLAARFIFRPIEDSSYFYFTQTISRDMPLEQQNKEKVNQTGKVLMHIIIVVTTIGLFALTFGQSYAHTVLLLYGGEEFVKDELPERLLQWHSLAICFIAVNGITEGYMFATNTSDDINKYNYLMAIFSICFIVLSFVLTAFLGPVGFIFANCINMFSRICYSVRFIYHQYKPIGINPLKGIVPGKLLALSLLISGLFCKYWTLTVSSLIYQLAAGVICVLVCFVAWCYENKELAILAWKYIIKRQKVD